MFRIGHPLRSEDLRRELLASSEEARVLARRLQVAERRMHMIELALLAAPTARQDVAVWPRVRIPLAPDEDTEMLGPCVVTRRVDSVNPLAEATVTGEEELLMEGSIWASLSPVPVAVFTASTAPAYAVRYNELVLPYVAGLSLDWRLIGTSGVERFSGVRRTVVVRTDALRSFDGIVELTSRSRFAVEEGYVHTAGGIIVRRSSWLNEGTATGSLRLERSGNFRIAAYSLYPGSRQPLSVLITVDGTSVAPGSAFSTTESSVIQASVVIDGLSCASHLELLLEEI